MNVGSGQWLVASNEIFTTEDTESTETGGVQEQPRIYRDRTDESKSKPPPRQKKAGWATLSRNFIRNNKLTGRATRRPRLLIRWPARPGAPCKRSLSGCFRRRFETCYFSNTRGGL